MTHETERGWYCREYFDVDTGMSGIECKTEKNGEVEAILEGKSLDDYEIEDEETGEWKIDDEALENDIEESWKLF